MNSRVSFYLRKFFYYFALASFLYFFLFVAFGSYDLDFRSYILGILLILGMDKIDRNIKE